MRILGAYAIVYVLAGLGRYADARGQRRDLRAGDLIVVFPDLGHSYGAQRGSVWDEFFILFDGPVFDLWRTQGLLDPGNPILHLEPIEYWRRRFEEVARRPTTVGSKHFLDRVGHLQVALGEALLENQHLPSASADAAWLSKACALLEKDLQSALKDHALAQQLGVSYEGFRKRFTKLAGMTPGKYRTTRLMSGACKLLHEGQLPIKEIAEKLGFCDQFHFARRFKQVLGKSPSQFRSLWKS
jgi:AraC-like DNA-binding protein